MSQSGLFEKFYAREPITLAPEDADLYDPFEEYDEPLPSIEATEPRDLLEPLAGPREGTQEALFVFEEPWCAEWRGMPEFVQEDLEPWKTIYVHFESPEALAAFAKLTAQTLTPRTRSIWYPEAEIQSLVDKRYICEP